METLNQNQILKHTRLYIEDFFKGESTGHDAFHTFRVTNLAVYIAKSENCNELFEVEMAALLHDVDDWKLGGDSNLSNAKNWMISQQLSLETINKIIDLIQQVSFKGSKVETPVSSLAAACVQDADRLDALGAIGIARTFAYGGKNNRLLYSPDEKPTFHDSYESYKTKQSSTFMHFYEKLFLLKDRMNTITAKEIANKRHQFMELYVKQFLEEWNFSENY